MQLRRSPVAPSRDAQFLGERLVKETEVMRAILTETIESAKRGNTTESGRTACGGGTDIRAPLQRFAQSVELSECPVGSTGIWHSHPTTRGLREPVHSIPDWANVIYTDLDASVVVGTQSSEVVVRAEDKQAAIEAFENAIGEEFDGARDVAQALRDGRITNPTATRQSIRQHLGPLHWRQPTPFPDINHEVSRLSIPAQDAIHVCSTLDSPQQHDDGRRSMALHRSVRRSSITANQAVSTEAAVSVFAILAGVGNGIAQLLGGYRLSGVPGDTIPLSDLAVPIGVSVVGAIAGAALLPSSGSQPDTIPSPHPTR